MNTLLSPTPPGAPGAPGAPASTPPPAFLNLRVEVDEARIGTISFDRPGGGPNILDTAVLQELNGALEILEARGGLRGVILTSAKENIFLAGADLKSLRHADVAELEKVVRLGHEVFAGLERIPFPTVAAIHGACLGGGLELALACRYRIATDASVTQLGLPETKLGLLPAWGGSTRLPRLLGLAAALDMILSGKSLKPAAALRAGLVDAVVPRAHLLAEARRLLDRPPGSRRRHWLGNLPPIPALIKWHTKRQLLKKTRGKYPAVERALEVTVASVHGPAQASFDRERAAFLSLVQSGESRHLIDLFFAREKARKSTAAASKDLAHVTVIGAGVMGSGIAQWLSAKSKHVMMQDVDSNRVAKGMQAVSRLYREAVKRKILTKHEALRGQDRIVPVTGKPPLHRMDLVIEAATENMELKKLLFQDLESRSAPETILATNTSALSIREIARGLQRPQRVIGLHFFNPVHRMELVEVVRQPDTPPDILTNAVAFVQSLGKLPVVVEDRPGFVVNRILLPYLLEAAELHAQGVPIHVIDESMLNAGMPMGPLRLLDEVGLDVALHVARTLAEAFPGRVHVPPQVEAMVAEGKLGKKSGTGYYGYARKGSARPPRDESATNSDPSRRLLLIMMNEAARCVEEQVAASPGDIDFAMVMGTGFAPFTGGPLHLADDWSAAAVVQELAKLAGESATPLRYAPCDLLVKMARDGTRFFKN